MSKLFRVVWVKSGEEVTFSDLRTIPQKEFWAKDLSYTNMSGFCVDEEGVLVLADCCGNYRVPPAEMFRVEWIEK